MRAILCSFLIFLLAFQPAFSQNVFDRKIITVDGGYSNGGITLEDDGDGYFQRLFTPDGQFVIISESDDLTDFQITTPSNGQLIIYDTDNFKNKTVSGDVTISQTGVTTIQANAVALGTDTTNPYVATITPGTGITGTGSGEGSTPTIALDWLGIEDLTDPNADRIAFWDDSAGYITWLTLGTNLSISGTTINATDSDTGQDIFVEGVAATDPDFIANGNISVLYNPGTGKITFDYIANSISLGLDTAGPYMAYVQTGTGLTGGSVIDGTEASNITIALDWLGIEDLTDPNADRIAFWDDSAGYITWLTLGTNLSITGTTLNAAGGGGGASAIDDLSDVVITAAANADILMHNGTNWVDSAPSAVKAALDLEIGTDIQAYDADLTTWAGNTPSAYFQTLINDADAATARGTLGLIIGTDIQAYDAELGDIAGLADPNADRLMFWDDSADAITYLTLGTNLSITGTTINAASASFGALTSDWDQTGAFDIFLDNASSELKILESTGATYYGMFDVGDLTANRTYTAPDASGTIQLQGVAGSFTTLATSSTSSLGGVVTQTNTNPDNRFVDSDANAGDYASIRFSQVTDGSTSTDLDVRWWDNSAASQKQLQIWSFDDSSVYFPSTGDVVLNNASNELKILESTGATYFGIFDVGDLTGHRTITIKDRDGIPATLTGTIDVQIGDMNPIAYGQFAACGAKAQPSTTLIFGYPFDKTILESLIAQVITPDDYDGGAITATIYWVTTNNSATLTDVIWNIGLACTPPNTDLSTGGSPYTYAGQVTDTNNSSRDINDCVLSATTPTNAAANTPLNVWVGRNGGDGSDDLDADAYVVGVKLTYTRR